jgi:hypothetical protein
MAPRPDAAISTEGADVAVGMCYSYATSDTYQEADAYVEPYGDITAGNTVETDTALFDSARSIGVAVDLILSPSSSSRAPRAT